MNATACPQNRPPERSFPYVPPESTSFELADRMGYMAEDLAFNLIQGGHPLNIDGLVAQLTPMPFGMSEFTRETVVAAVRRAVELAAEVEEAAARNEAVCPECGGESTAGPGTRVHYGRLVCSQCERFLGWLPKPKKGGGDSR